MTQPVAYDFYCGLGGWAEGFLAEGFYVIGYDIEKHDYGTGTYPGELRLRDVLDIHGRECKDATVLVASPPCQEPSYRAMPWKRAKALNAVGPPHKFIALFEACFRIQREASEAAGHYIPLIVENVVGAQRWVGRARWHFGSYYLWGDVPALMPFTSLLRKSLHTPLVETPPGTGRTSWFFGNSKHEARWYGMKTLEHLNKRNGECHTRHLTNPGEHEIKLGGCWFHGYRKGQGPRNHGSNSRARARASAEIAKIPFPLARHIAQCFRPVPVGEAEHS